MTQIKMRFQFLLAVLVFACCLFIPMTFAFADESGVGPQDDLVENSWRYSNGTPLFSGDDTASISLQSDDGISMQSVMLLKPVGIDVSQHQGVIDWARVAQTNIEYVIIRCGYGNDYESQDDRQWLNNVKGCQDNDLQFGVYLYSYAYNVEMAKSEGQHVVRALQRAGLTPADVRFPIYYDIEHEGIKDGEPDENYSKLTPDDYNAMWLAFKKVLNDAGYNKVGVYASASWWRDRLFKISLPEDYIWYARYGSNDPEKPLQATDDPFSGFESLRSKNLGIWQYSSVGRIDGIAGNVDMNYCRSDLPFYYPKGSTLDMYRLYNPNTGEHLYTTDASECSHLSKIGWVYEGVGWVAPKTSNVPVYRLYNPNSGDHHYTMNKAEYDWLINDIGWVGENIGWYSDANKNVPLYRLFNPNAAIGTHHYTTNAAERDWLKGLGWVYEGECWFGV